MRLRKLRLIENWRRAHKLYSVQLAAIIALLGYLQVNVLPNLNAQLTEHQYALANMGLAALVWVVRVIRQGPDALSSREDEQ